MDERIGIAVIAAVFVLSPALYCRRVAAMKGFPLNRWFIAGLLFNIFAIYAVRYSPSRIYSCPDCHHDFVAGAENCDHCGRAFPDAYAMSSIVKPGGEFDGECAECATPYSLADYRPDTLEIRCSRCDSVLLRR